MADSRHRLPPRPRWRGRRRVLAVAGAFAGAAALVAVTAWATFVPAAPRGRAPVAVPVVPGPAASGPLATSATARPSAAASGGTAAASGGTAAAPGATTGRLLFGIGDEADRAAATPLARQAPVRMLTSWFNRPADFGDFLDGWRATLVPRWYAQGYALHVVEWAPEGEGPVATKYGPACGRPYPLSAAFLADMKHLAQIFGGTRTGPPLYVTLFTEFSTYPCVDNEWDSAANYYLALKDQYRAAYQVLHANAANVRVSLGFGGWLGTYDYPQRGGGISLLDHFTDLMRMSDFQSFQAMADNAGENPAQIRAMVRILHPYGPVMLAHYRPDNGSQDTFDADVHTILTDAFVGEITAAGLFAMSFMSADNVDARADTFAFVRAAVARYGRVGDR